jgi:hypothetical protein
VSHFSVLCYPVRVYRPRDGLILRPRSPSKMIHKLIVNQKKPEGLIREMYKNNVY